jgi:serine protease Do
VPSLAPLVREVKDAVVHVEAGAGREGSGFVLDAAGWIVTNAHVIGAAASPVRVRLPTGLLLAAEIVGRDETTDLALLKLLTPPPVLAHAWVGDSDALEVGDWVIAIGNPFGLSQSVSQGVVSAKERVLGLGPFDEFLQTDVLMNPGNSGGPLFNMRGEVVGVTTARISEGQGIGFAVPINLVKELLPQLAAHGKVVRGWIGLNVAEVAEGAGRAIVVREVVAGGPAAQAGIVPGDRLTALDGKAVAAYLPLLRQVALSPPGTRLAVRVLRAGKTVDMTVTSADLPRRK